MQNTTTNNTGASNGVNTMADVLDSPKLPGLSIVVVAYNEEGSLEQVITTALKVSKEIAEFFEIIIINDGSNDQTGYIADRLARTHKEIKVIHHIVNIGYGSAQKRGFAHAQYDFITVVPADNQFDMCDLRKYIPLIRDADIVIGVRRTRNDSMHRRLYTKMFRFLMRLMFGIKFWDIGWVHLYRKSVINGLKLESQGMGINAEIIIQARNCGCRFREVNVQYLPRISGTSTTDKLSNILIALKEFMVIWYRNYLEPVGAERLTGSYPDPDLSGAGREATHLHIPPATLKQYLSSPKPLSRWLPFHYHYFPPLLRLGVAQFVSNKKPLWHQVAGLREDFSGDATVRMGTKKEDLAECQPNIVLAGSDGPRWPDHKRYALILTHDVDSQDGFRNIPRLQEIEAKFGLRSTWNIVAHHYRIDFPRLEQLVATGNEIGSHGYNHNNKLAYLTVDKMNRCLAECVKNLKDYHPKGFRSPSLCRTPRLFQQLAKFFIYDSSIPANPVPFWCRANNLTTEPVPTRHLPDRTISVVRAGNNTLGLARHPSERKFVRAENDPPERVFRAGVGLARQNGTLGLVFPFFIGSLVELPLTMPMEIDLLIRRFSWRQIHEVWLSQLIRIKSAGGLVVLNTHPESHLSGSKQGRATYTAFLKQVASDSDAWITLAQTIALSEKKRAEERLTHNL